VDFKQDSPRGCGVVAGLHGADGAKRRGDTIPLSAKLFYLSDEYAGEGSGEFGDDVRTTVGGGSTSGRVFSEGAGGWFRVGAGAGGDQGGVVDGSASGSAVEAGRLAERDKSGDDARWVADGSEITRAATEGTLNESGCAGMIRLLENRFCAGGLFVFYFVAGHPFAIF